MMSRTRFRLIMIAPILMVLLNTLIASRALAKLFDAQHWLAHTLEVITQLEETSYEMSSANNAVRAYLLTGSKEYADRYYTLAASARTDAAKLANLTTDNQGQQARLAFLKQRMSVRFGALEAAMGLRRAHGAERLSPTILDPALRESPDSGPSVRYVLGEIRKEEERLLAERESDAQSARTRVKWTFAGASILDLVLIVWAFQQLIDTSRNREQLAARAAEITVLNNKLHAANADLGNLNADLERRVEERTRELEISNQELQAFSYSVSHDLRAPLRTIDGFSLALAEDFGEVLSAEGRDYIQRVRAGVQRMGTLIDALLQLSRVTRSDLQREPVDLSQLASVVFSELFTNETGRDAAFTAQPGLVTEADPRLMRVAFENLLGNALKFTSKTASARIEFGAVDQPGETVYFIRDNGAGFDMQYVDRLFTAFQRLHGDRDFKGSGIGLATVSRIIRRHHGRIWAEGAIGQGATFFFTLNG